MKRLAIAFIAIATVLLASCASLMGEPTVIGKWAYTDEYGDSVYYYFTTDGKYVKVDGSYTDFGDYEYDEDAIVFGGKDHYYVFEGRKLFMNGYQMRKVSSKATNNSANIRGVWELKDNTDTISIGFTVDGDVVCMGSYNNRGGYSVDVQNGTITVKGRTSDYIIVNNELFIDGLRFADLSDVVRFSRKTSSGINQSVKEILSSNGWFYQNVGSYNVSGVLYNFYSNGKFHAYNVSNGNITTEFSGTYSFEYPYAVDLGDNGGLTFCVIDGVAFGYN